MGAIVPLRPNPEQTSLDQLAELEQVVAERARYADAASDAGMTSAVIGDPVTAERVESFCYDLKPGETTTSDVIASRFGRSKATGPVLNALARRGVLELVSFTKSEAPENHARRIGVWRRLP